MLHPFSKICFGHFKNSPKGELDALKDLSQNKHIIKTFEKGNSIVIVDGDKYIKKMENYVNDTCNFQRIAVNDDDFLNIIISLEKCITKFVKSFLPLTVCLKKHKDI